jgi:hypothetical protein
MRKLHLNLSMPPYLLNVFAWRDDVFSAAAPWALCVPRWGNTFLVIGIVPVVLGDCDEQEVCRVVGVGPRWVGEQGFLQYRNKWKADCKLGGMILADASQPVQHPVGGVARAVRLLVVGVAKLVFASRRRCERLRLCDSMGIWNRIPVCLVPFCGHRDIDSTGDMDAALRHR